MKNRTIPSKLSVVTLALLICLTTVAWAQSETEFSGFLSDYSGLEPFKELDGALVYRHPDRILGNYDKLMFDLMAIYFHPEAESKEIRPDELKMLTDYALNAAIKAVNDKYPVVDEPAPGVARVRAAITNVEPTRKGKMIVGQAAPSGAGMMVGVPVPLKVPLGIGSATIEAEIVDSLTGERIAAIVDRRGMGRGLPVISTFNFSRYQRFAAAKDAFDYWAARLRIAMDRSHGEDK